MAGNHGIVRHRSAKEIYELAKLARRMRAPHDDLVIKARSFSGVTAKTFHGIETKKILGFIPTSKHLIQPTNE